jgi:acyl-CoA thioester hydrolase
MPFSVPLRVRFAECDMQGHVFNAHYLTWFDLAHTEALRAATGLPYLEIVRTYGVDVVVAETHVRHFAPAHFDDELEIEVVFDEPSTSSLTSRFVIHRGADLLADGWVRHVCVDAEAYTKAPWPEGLRAALRPYVAGAASTATPSRPT